MKWIPVGERLPEPGIDVLVFHGIGADVAYWSIADEQWFSSLDDELMDRQVSHWMPLPEPPKD